MLSAPKIRAARALLGWTQGRLAAEAGLSKTGLVNLENGADSKASTLERVERALTNAGVRFTEYGAELPPPPGPSS